MMRLASLMTGASSVEAANWSMFISSDTSRAISSVSASASSSAWRCASWMMSSIVPRPLSRLFSLSRMAFSDAIIGMTSSFVVRFTSSRARTFSGSAIARNNLLSRRETGSTLWLVAISRGTRPAVSGGIPMRLKLTGGTLSTRPIDTTMSTSPTYDFSRISLSRRVPSFFWRSSSSSTCLVESRPSSTSASAMRSPKLLMGGIKLRSAESLPDDFHQFRRRTNIPQQPVLRRVFKVPNSLLVERISCGDKEQFAHAFERQDAPALTNLARETPRQIDVNVIFVERQKTEPGTVTEKPQRFVQRQQPPVGQELNERLDDCTRWIVHIRGVPKPVEVAGGNQFAIHENLLHCRLAIIDFSGGSLFFDLFGRARLLDKIDLAGHGETAGLAFDFRQRRLHVGIVRVALQDAFVFEDGGG